MCKEREREREIYRERERERERERDVSTTAVNNHTASDIKYPSLQTHILTLASINCSLFLMRKIATTTMAMRSRTINGTPIPTMMGRLSPVSSESGTGDKRETVTLPTDHYETDCMHFL